MEVSLVKLCFAFFRMQLLSLIKKTAGPGPWCFACVNQGLRPRPTFRPTVNQYP